jgi:transcriptional regulator with XRE-family HTH domain
MVDGIPVDDVGNSLEQIGATLREARLRALLTQSEVGQRAGVSRQLVSRIEQGCNGEISAYISVAVALQHRFAVLQEADIADNEFAGLDLQ